MARSSHNPTDASPFVYKPNDAQVPGQGAGASPEQAVSASAVQSVPGGSSAFSGIVSAFNPPSGAQDDPGVAYGYRKSLFGHKDEVSVYTAQMDAKHALDKRTRTVVVSTVLLVLVFFAALILPTGLFGSGKPAPTPALIVANIQGNITGLINWLTGGPVTSGISIVFWQVLAVPVVGAALALNGCVFQSALRNALAAPSTLGVISGASLGTIVYALVFATPEQASEFYATTADELIAQVNSMDLFTYIVSVSGRALCSFAGCLIVVALVLAIAHIAGRGKLSKVSLIIAGQVFTALIAGVISVIRTYIYHYGSLEQQEALDAVSGGSFESIVNPTVFLVMAVPILVGIIVIFLLRFRMNLLVFNDDEARTMGIKTTATRNAVVIICTVLTGVVVSFVGSVGFVGFLVPHIARKVVGPDLRYLIPASALFGAIFLLVAYYLMQLTGVFAGSIGTLTSLVGAVAFLVIAIRERARGNIDWV